MLRDKLSILQIMFYGQAAIGTYGMLFFAYVGKLGGMLTLLCVTVISSIFILSMLLDTIERFNTMNGSNFSHVAITNTPSSSGHIITARSFTNEPNKFKRSVPNKDGAHTIHHVPNLPQK